MKSNWFAYKDYVSYSGATFIGYIHFISIDYNIYFDYFLSEGTGGKDTPLRRTESFKEAIEFIEKFFELSVSEQREQFNAMLKEA